MPTLEFRAGELYVHKDSNTVFTYIGSQYVGHDMKNPIHLVFREITGTMLKKTFNKNRAEQVMLKATPMVRALYARKQD